MSIDGLIGVLARSSGRSFSPHWCSPCDAYATRVSKLHENLKKQHFYWCFRQLRKRPSERALAWQVCICQPADRARRPPSSHVGRAPIFTPPRE